jgi:chloramphenicol-sensitive protein RarD
MVSAFAIWGLSPIYYKWVQAVPAWELMAHRVVWLVLFLVVFMVAYRRFRLLEIYRTPKLLWGLLASSVMITINWSLYVWANVNNQVLATSLGYFINPLVSVFLGVIFLGERLNIKQVFALCLVLVAVANMIWQVGELPWIALTLAITFGLYGLIRKQLEIDSFNGLLFEALVVFPLAIIYLGYLQKKAELVFGTTTMAFDLLIMFSGIVTLLPLVFFAVSVKHIPLSTVGFIQYLAPTTSFLLAVFLFNEPFSIGRLISFVLIWTALVLISIDAWRQRAKGARL